MSLDESPPAAPSLDYLSFCLGEQNYCLNIDHIREIRSNSHETPLPKAPDYMRGVINLRGTVLPIMDMSRRLALDEMPSNSRSVIIVTEGDRGAVGLLVSAVSDILSLSAEDLLPVPAAYDKDTGAFVSALAIRDDDLLRVLDLDEVLNTSLDNAQPQISP